MREEYCIHWYQTRIDLVLDLVSKKLTRFTPTFEGRLSDELVDQAWFPLDWQRNPHGQLNARDAHSSLGAQATMRANNQDARNGQEKTQSKSAGGR